MQDRITQPEENEMNKPNFAILALVFILAFSACSQQTQTTPFEVVTPISATATHPSGKGLESQATPAVTIPAGTDTSILEWERTGGIAGICQTMLVNQDFTFQMINCASGKMIVSGELTSEQAGFVEDLQNRYDSFQWQFNPPPGSADMFLDRYTLFGKGTIIPSAEVQAAINQDLANLANELLNPNNSTPTS
jgi:hypothetical protein